MLINTRLGIYDTDDNTYEKADKVVLQKALSLGVHIHGLDLDKNGALIEISKQSLALKQETTGVEVEYIDGSLHFFNPHEFIPELWLTQYCDKLNAVFAFKYDKIGKLIFTDDLIYDYKLQLPLDANRTVIDVSGVSDKSIREFLYKSSLTRALCVVENPSTIGVGDEVQRAVLNRIFAVFINEFDKDRLYLLRSRAYADTAHSLIVESYISPILDMDLSCYFIPKSVVVLKWLDINSIEFYVYIREIGKALSSNEKLRSYFHGLFVYLKIYGASHIQVPLTKLVDKMRLEIRQVVR